MAGRNPRSAAAEAAFRARLDELGATLVEPEWLGSGRPHRVRCSAGHDCMPTPGNVQRGQGVCRTCSLAPGARRRKSDSIAAEAKFRSRLAELGATLLEPWVSNKYPHVVLCASGHECTPIPTSVMAGNGVCLACVGRDSRVAATNFHARVAELGGVVLEPEWLGAGEPHHILCAKGPRMLVPAKRPPAGWRDLPHLRRPGSCRRRGRPSGPALPSLAEPFWDPTSTGQPQSWFNARPVTKATRGRPTSGEEMESAGFALAKCGTCFTWSLHR